MQSPGVQYVGCSYHIRVFNTIFSHGYDANAVDVDSVEGKQNCFRENTREVRVEREQTRSEAL